MSIWFKVWFGAVLFEELDYLIVGSPGGGPLGVALEVLIIGNSVKCFFKVLVFFRASKFVVFMNKLLNY